MADYYVGEIDLGLHLRHLRRLADGAGRLHRPGLPGPRRLPRHRRLRPRLLHPARLPWVVSRGAGRRAHHGVRHPRRPAGAAHDRHLPHHRHAGLRGHHPGGVHALGVGDAAASTGMAVDKPVDLRRSRSPTTRLLLPLPGLPGRGAVADRATCCARPPAAPGSPSATARSPRSRWASTSPSTRSMAFAYSAALMGLAGALFAHKIAYPRARHLHHPAVDPVPAAGDRGRPGLLHGALFGAIFVALLPPLIAILRDSMPAAWRSAARHVLGADRQPRPRHRRPLPQAARRRARHLRPDPGAVHPASSRSASTGAG